MVCGDHWEYIEEVRKLKLHRGAAAGTAGERLGDVELSEVEP